MPIIQITGSDPVANRTIADMLRNNQINNGKGALLIDPAQGGEPRFLLEKLVEGSAQAPKVAPDGSAFVPVSHFGVEPGDDTLVVWNADRVAWKPDPLVVLLGGDTSILDQFEAIAPGFKAMMGPVRTLPVDVLDV